MSFAAVLRYVRLEMLQEMEAKGFLNGGDVAGAAEVILLCDDQHGWRRKKS